MDCTASIWEKPAAESPEALIKRVNELVLLSGKRAHGLSGGTYTSGIHGAGLEPAGARKYVHGEAIRQIDWNMTARMNEPYVRLFGEERQRDVFLLLDVSASMRTGWQERRKIEYAVELAASVAFSAAEAGDRLGFVACADSVKEIFLPEPGRGALFHTVRRFYEYALEESTPSAFTDLSSAVQMLRDMKGRRFMIFVFSDFIGCGIPDDMKYLKALHDVMLIHVYDPFEYKNIPEISFCGTGAEGRAVSSIYSPGSLSGLDEKENFIADAAGRLNIAFRSFSSAEPPVAALRKLYAGRIEHGKSSL